MQTLKWIPNIVECEGQSTRVGVVPKTSLLGFLQCAPLRLSCRDNPAWNVLEPVCDAAFGLVKGLWHWVRYTILPCV
jgi:hypothetical protein